MPEEESQCEQRGAGADPPGTTMGTGFGQPELEAATAALARRVRQVRRKALKIAYRARPWLDRRGQIDLDKILLIQDPTPVLVNLIGLLQDDIDRLIALEYHLVRMLPLTIRLQVLHVKILHELNRLSAADISFLTKCRQLGIAFGGAQHSVEEGATQPQKECD
jgi:hypothetical protein